MADQSLAACCVYAIRNLNTGRRYIGSAVQFSRRMSQHRHRLRLGNHHSAKLQASWVKHGEGAFVFEILETVSDPADLIATEQKWLDQAFAKQETLYNMRTTAESRRGHVPSAATLEKQAAARVGRKLSPEHRKNIGLSLKGIRLTAERRARISAALTGYQRGPMSVETRQKMSAARKGVLKGPMSLEQRQKLSLVHAGKKRGPTSDATRAAISAAKKGKPYGHRKKAQEEVNKARA